jgi:thiamine-phosphate pyrophosphorylase
MRWQDSVFRNFRLYAVTDVRGEDPLILRKIEAAYRGGADIVQLRSKVLADGELCRLGASVKKIAVRHRKLFFVNDRTDLALAIGADGVHLGQEDLPVAVARRLAKVAGKKLLIGKSTHSLEQALSAVKEPVDYIGVGPVFKTPTKRDSIPVGLELIRWVKAAVSKPFVAIGGIDCTNLEAVLRAGATRVAVVRAIFSAKNPAEASKKLKEEILGYESRQA